MNKMFKFNGMPYKRSGRAGGKSVSTIGMLVLLLVALLVLPSCFDDDEVEVEVDRHVCANGNAAPDNDPDQCPPPPDPVDRHVCANGDAAPDNDPDQCPPEVACGAGSTLNVATNTCEIDDDVRYETVGETTAMEPYMAGDDDDMVKGTDGPDFIEGGKGKDTIRGMDGVDNIDGGPGNDTLYGDGGNDTLTGGEGDDTLKGGADDDELTGGGGNNEIDGGPDDDTVVYLDAGQVKVKLGDGTADGTAIVIPQGGSGGNIFGGATRGDDILKNIENVKGSHGADIIDGNDNANRLEGLDGADMINGNDGDDTIIPNRPMPTADDTTDPVMDGSDVVDGGEHGDNGDTISYEGEEDTRGVDIDLSDVVTAVEADDSDPNNIVAAVIAHVLVTVTNGENDMITVTGEGTEDDPHVSTIENIIGSPNDDTLAGDSRDNIIDGGPGGGTIDGGPGNDTLTGSGTINGGLGNDTLTGGPGGDNLNGGGGSDTIYAGVNSSGQSNDTIDAGDGTGIDDDPDTDADESAGETDIVSFAMVTEDTVEDVDADMATQGDQGVTATILATWNAEQVHGSPLPDSITGSNGRDMIVGHGGNDTLIAAGANNTNDEVETAFEMSIAAGKALADVLVGAGGNDTLTGAAGDNVEVFAVHVNEGGGNDMITNFTLGDDHLHFVAAEVTHTCALAAADDTAICTLSTGQTVTITYTGTLSDPLDLDTDLNIVNDPNAGR